MRNGLPNKRTQPQRHLKRPYRLVLITGCGPSLDPILETGNADSADLLYMRIRAQKSHRKGWFYWATVLILVLVGIFLGKWLEVQEFALRPRYRIYQSIQQGPRKPFVQRTVIVLIGDEEYWKGDLARRVPIKRDYLAKLISQLDKLDPAVIALDFDLRSQTADGSIIESQDYARETSEFLATLKEVSLKRWIVVPKTLNFDRGFYTTESDIYDLYDFGEGKISKGYSILPSDIRKLPLQKTTKDGTRIDSFAGAIVRAVNKAALQPVANDTELPFFSYLPLNAFEQLSPTQVLQGDPQTKQKIQYNVVIVGSGWNINAYGRGGLADGHLTPVGPLPGVYLHANYVEALLDNRTSKPYRDFALHIVEAIVALMVALVFARLARLIWKIGAVILLVVGLVLYGYVSLLMLGWFYDFFVPVILVVIHAIYEWMRETFSVRRKQTE